MKKFLPLLGFLLVMTLVVVAVWATFTTPNLHPVAKGLGLFTAIVVVSLTIMNQNHREYYYLGRKVQPSLIEHEWYGCFLGLIYYRLTLWNQKGSNKGWRIGLYDIGTKNASINIGHYTILFDQKVAKKNYNRLLEGYYDRHAVPI